MAENLKVTHYNDGDAIVTGLDNDTWPSTEEGAYAVYNDTLSYVETYEGDIVTTYCNDVLVGSRAWAGSYTDIPAMGVDGSEYTYNYCEIGSIPTFKVEKIDGEIFELEGDISAWENNGLFMVSSLGVKQAFPEQYSLSNAYPNPFNPITTINFSLPEDNKVLLEVYDINGRKINTLINKHIKAGYHDVIWNANHNSSGIYFIKMISGSYVSTGKVVLIK